MSLEPADDVLADAGVTSDASFTNVFAAALRGEACTVVGIGDAPEHLPVSEWKREADEADRALLALCEGPTLDIGCGPGRMAEHLSEVGHTVLGIDVVHEAVLQTRDRGVSAIVRNVFDTLPGEGRWQTALLADGNIGIGGDPIALLGRIKELLDPGGRVVVELSPPGAGFVTMWACLESGGLRSRPFRWSVVGTDAVDEVAAEVGLSVQEFHQHGDRWFTVLVSSS
ncbi:methyltransferase domain-containing protein [uncultured Nocardioides sp.]|uniref:methyltransferase domain-containing protein n=1 Tax=uncultured Nocardioides sp. TaxID=198441 RepID=UPI00260BE8DD|nr:methyltransferase domain-containing protein [uncultured Nocardioides sp.]